MKPLSQYTPGDLLLVATFVALLSGFVFNMGKLAATDLYTIIATRFIKRRDHHVTK